MRKDNEGYFIPMKGILHQDDIKILNIYGPNADTANFIKHILQDLKQQIHPSTEIATSV